MEINLNFFIMKYLFIKHKYPINKLLSKNFLTNTLKLDMNKNHGFQEKKIELKYKKNQGCLEKTYRCLKLNLLRKKFKNSK